MTNELKQWEFYIAGVQHHKLYTCIDKLEVDQYLPMVREPSNKYDPCAVKIVYISPSEGVMIGYVPSKISPQVNAAIVDENLIVSCRVLEINPDEKPWKQCRVIVEVTKK